MLVSDRTNRGIVRAKETAMNKSIESKWERILVAAALAVALLAAGRAGAVERSVDLGGASSAAVEIKMGGQTLEVFPALLEA